MIIILPKDVQFILESLSNAGHLAYIVGGCVRDSIMGITPKDWDIASSAQPHETKQVFSHTVDTGIKHGTVTAVLRGYNYEITTFRVDGNYIDGRHPDDVTFTTDIEEDLSRRDFTMNAIAYSPAEGLVDPFGGLEDIRRESIRCVGHAPSRFSEDALRMLRAIRFSAQMSFSIEPNTYRAIAPLAERLGLISIERVREELTKILSSPNPGALKMLKETGLLPQMLNHIDIKQASVWLNKCPSPKEPAMLYALLNTKNITRRLKFDNRTIKECELYIHWLRKDIADDRYSIKTVLNIMGPDLLGNLLTLKGIYQPEAKAHWEDVRAICKDILKSGECFCLKDLDIDGQTLINAGIPPGKEMGRIISELLNMVMIDPYLNKKETLIEIACKIS